MMYSAASHQRAIKMLWLHFWGAVLLSMFIYDAPIHTSICLNLDPYSDTHHDVPLPWHPDPHWRVRN